LQHLPGEMVPFMHLRGPIRYVLASCLAAFTLAASWVVLVLYAGSQVATSNRSYAETWQGASMADLLRTQALTPHRIEASPNTASTIVRYHFDGWRGMKGRRYPGSPFAFVLREDNLYMESGPRFYTPPVSAWCEIAFSSDAAGIVTEVSYRGNDCE